MTKKAQDIWIDNEYWRALGIEENSVFFLEKLSGQLVRINTNHLGKKRELIRLAPDFGWWDEHSGIDFAQLRCEG